MQRKSLGVLLLAVLVLGGLFAWLQRGGEGARQGARPPLLPALRAAFDEIVERGLGDRDISVSRRFVAERGASPA